MCVLIVSACCLPAKDDVDAELFERAIGIEPED